MLHHPALQAALQALGQPLALGPAPLSQRVAAVVAAVTAPPRAPAAALHAQEGVHHCLGPLCTVDVRQRAAAGQGSQGRRVGGLGSEHGRPG